VFLIFFVEVAYVNCIKRIYDDDDDGKHRNFLGLRAIMSAMVWTNVACNCQLCPPVQLSSPAVYVSWRISITIFHDKSSRHDR